MTAESVFFNLFLASAFQIPEYIFRALILNTYNNSYHKENEFMIFRTQIKKKSSILHYNDFKNELSLNYIITIM